MSSKQRRVKRLRLVRLDVAQEGCPLADSSREDDTYIEVTSAALRGNDSILMVWASGGTKSLISRLRNSSIVRRFHVLSIDSDTSWIYMVKESSGILKTIYEAEGILASSIIIHNGVKRFTVMLPSKNIGRLKEAAERNLKSRGFNVSIADVTYLLREESSIMRGVHIPFTMIKNEVISKLTPMEKKVLIDMISNGYFEWPRKNDLSEVALKYGLSKSTVSYHIRSAEKKILDILINKYKLLEEWWWK